MSQENVEEAWDLLREPAQQAPVHIPDFVLKRGNGDIGWPPGHPWTPRR